ncbi:MAG TPA: hypothetical protein VG389_20990 [Myxococcota bacterium]|nr:hypothetical protein [Myxococcota bacterium]
MHDTLTAYFDGEKRAGLLVAGVGLAVLAAAAVLFPARWGLRPFAITLAVGGLFELAVGVGLYLKTGPQVAKLVQQLASDPAAFYAAERARMTVVQRNFVYLEFAWLALIGSSAVLALWKKQAPLASGIALGLLLTVVVILAFDIVAERRGAAYLDALNGPAAATPAAAAPR